MANARINIVYPIDGQTLPFMDPPAGPLSSAYVTLSFGLTWGGGPRRVAWGVDRAQLGQAKFYNQFTCQQVSKLRGGRHKFWVKAKGGGANWTHVDSVMFEVGS